MNRGLHAVTVILCTGCFLYQAYEILVVFLRHPTSKTTSLKTLGEVGMPRVEICLNNGYDLEFLKEQGYNRLGDYVNGKSNDSFIGWAGNQGLTTMELLAQAYSWKNLTDVIQLLKVNGQQSSLSVLKEAGMNYPEGKCYVLDPKSVAFSDQPVTLIIQFKEALSPTIATISITDHKRATWRRDVFTYQGDSIIKNLKDKEKTSDIYNIQVAQTVDLEADLEASCTEYTNTNYIDFRYPRLNCPTTLK